MSPSNSLSLLFALALLCLIGAHLADSDDDSSDDSSDEGGADNGCDCPCPCNKPGCARNAEGALKPCMVDKCSKGTYWSKCVWPSHTSAFEAGCRRHTYQGLDHRRCGWQMPAKFSYECCED